jgi:hydrogenase expression/formation protein HypC
MCLAIPAKVVSIGDMRMADVDILGVSRVVSLDLVPEAVVGDHVLVHAGYAIQVVDEQFAKETLDLLRQLDLAPEEMDGIELPDGAPAAAEA